MRKSAISSLRGPSAEPGSDVCLALEEQKTIIVERLKSGVITVGQGRGFVVEGAGERLVITARVTEESTSKSAGGVTTRLRL